MLNKRICSECHCFSKGFIDCVDTKTMFDGCWFCYHNKEHKKLAAMTINVSVSMTSGFSIEPPLCLNSNCEVPDHCPYSLEHLMEENEAC